MDGEQEGDAVAAGEPAGLRQAVERNAEAVRTGNLAQLMADITPEALADMMRAAPSGLSMANFAQLPEVTGWSTEYRGREGDAEAFSVTFESAAGTATLLSRWRRVVGQWKVVGVQVVAAEAAEGADPAMASAVEQVRGATAGEG
jgi:hypothetical protein